jgi:hypothetical protein
MGCPWAPPAFSDVIQYPAPVPQRHDKQQDDRGVQVSTGDAIRRADTHTKQTETKEQAENAGYEHDLSPYRAGGGCAGSSQSESFE